MPQNYQAIGIAAVATPPNRRPSAYLGPSVRLRTFGDKGLASLATGITMRSVLRFPDLQPDDSSKPLSKANPATLGSDSAVLKGQEQYRVHWFLAVNLGFRIGAFGPGQDEK